MSTRRAAAVDARRSIEAKAEDEDVEMMDGSDEDMDEDAEGESELGDAEGGPGLFKTIQDLTTYLCSVEEE